MNAVVFSLAATVLGVGAHAVALRHLPQRWRLLTLPAALLVAFIGLLLMIGASPEDSVVALILTLSFGFAYALMLVGVIYDSPTLALVNVIESHEPAGMPVTAFDAFVACHPFLQSRLSALIAAKELGVEGDELLLTGKAVHLLRVGDAYRRLRGDDATATG